MTPHIIIFCLIFTIISAVEGYSSYKDNELKTINRLIEVIENEIKLQIAENENEGNKQLQQKKINPYAFKKIPKYFDIIGNILKPLSTQKGPKKKIILSNNDEPQSAEVPKQPNLYPTDILLQPFRNIASSGARDSMEYDGGVDLRPKDLGKILRSAWVQRIHSVEEGDLGVSSNQKKKKKKTMWIAKYPFWNYWTYQKELYDDTCPGNRILMDGMCVAKS